MNTVRVVKTIIDNDLLLIRLPQFGYELHYKIHPLVTVDPITKFDDGLPDFTTEINLEFLKTVKLKDAKTQDEVANILKKESIIPQHLVYDHVLLGFVYSSPEDPNNHRWWLDFRDSKNQSVYNYFADKVEVNCPITTKSWHDQDPNGIWHGRMVFSNTEIQSIMEPDFGKLTINGKLRSECKPIDSKRVCSTQNMPEETESLRLRYNIREDIWFCDILDKKDKQIGQIPCKSIISDARMYGEVRMVGNKPKVSTRINISDISDVAVAINSLIIRGIT